MTGADDKPTVGWSEVLKGISTLLLPPRVTATLLREEIDTLIVIPITVRAFDPATDLPSAQRDKKDESLARRLTLTVATIPFAALPLGDTMLVDRMSVVVAPGFFIFAQDPSTTSGLSAPIVVGDSANPDFRALPGANEEAQVVAAALKTVPLLGQQATKSAVEALIKKSADRVDYIHFATHGVADATNPLDGSFLVLNDGPWTAREISQFRRQLPSAKGRTQRPSDAPLLRAKPLVVMSACQTALGKDFDVGTTGLARAWLWAGASNVVMSLWSVDDHATKTLMTAFVEEISRGRPADQAMRQAALAMRGSHGNPGYWASFGIFGAPQAARPSARTARE
jgi:CHAT domain-containing protein